MGERVEAWYPAIVAAAVAAAFWHYLSDYSLPETTKDLLGAVISLAAISIGFLATVKSLLVSLAGRPDVAWLIKGEFYDRFHRYVFQAIYASFVIATASTVILLLLKPIESLAWRQHLAAGYVALLTFTGAATFRVLTVFSLMMKNRPSA